MLDSITSAVYQAILQSPSGITTLDILESLQLCSRSTLKTILSRLNKAKKIVRLKRGTYSVYPLTDAFAAAQMTFNGYLGFSTALYLHKFTTELPFTVFVATSSSSSSKIIGSFEFKAVALKEKAVGFERKGDCYISTRAKTLFDCIYLSNYAIEKEKLVNAFKEMPLNQKEWKEFHEYVKRFIKKKHRKRFNDFEKNIRG